VGQGGDVHDPEWFCGWRECGPAIYGPIDALTTGFVRWSRDGHLRPNFANLAAGERGRQPALMIDRPRILRRIGTSQPVCNKKGDHHRLIRPHGKGGGRAKPKRCLHAVLAMVAGRASYLSSHRRNK